MILIWTLWVLLLIATIKIFCLESKCKKLREENADLEKALSMKKMQNRILM